MESVNAEDAGQRALLEIFEEGAALFGLLGRLFHGVPDRELFAAAVDGRVFDDVPLLPAQACREGLDKLVAWQDDCAAPFSSADYEELQADYAHLFVGTRRVLAPMWESVYFNRDRMVFQRQTFQVRADYARYGLEVDALSHEPDDHLAYELLFVARLFEVAGAKMDDGDKTGASEVLGDLGSFTSRHLLMWLPMWVPLVVRHARADFYPGYARLVLDACKYVDDQVARWQAQAALGRGDTLSRAPALDGDAV